MAIFDIFKFKKNKETKAKKEVKKAKAARPAKKTVEKKEEPLKIEPIKPQKPIKKVPGKAYRILDFPHVTEKASLLAKRNMYIFRVHDGANKTEIKKAIEDMFGKKVIGVRIINTRPKQRRVGKHSGWKKGYKKAVVQLQAGEKIEILPK